MSVKDNTYFIYPEGSAWVAARFSDGELVGTAYEADADSHAAANDAWAGCVPEESDVEVDGDEAAEIVAAVLGDDADPAMVVVTRSAPEYTLEMRDGGSSETEDCGTDRPDSDECDSLTRDWVREGDWGTEGASISARWTLYEDGEEIDEGGTRVEIDPDHEAMIVSACGGKHSSEYERCCGTDPDDHDWTSEGEGGLDSNPGVWSTGGTSMSFASHCRVCGLHRSEHSTGSQRNPGEHDTVHYEMPESWCAECESEECSCEDA